MIRKDDHVVYGNSGYLGAPERPEIINDETLSQVEFRINKPHENIQSTSLSFFIYTGTVAYIPYLYDTEVNEDGSVLSGKIGIEYVDAPNIFPVTWKNGEVSECIFAFG